MIKKMTRPIVNCILDTIKKMVRQGGKWTWRMMRIAAIPLEPLSINYKRMLDEQFLCSHPHRKDLKSLHNRVKGLHSLLPKDDRYSYSILIPVYKPKPQYLKEAIESALAQTAEKMEVLIGFDGPQPKEVYDVVYNLQKEHPEILKSFQIDREKEGGGISASTNFLAKHAKGNFILLMDHDDWIRPDLLYRYELTLRLTKEPENTVLYCNEYKINEKGYPILRTQFRKPDTPIFPYIFFNFICHCLLIPRTLLTKVGPLRPETDGAQDFDLVLRLDAIGACFKNVPFYLYAWRSHDQSTAKNAGQKNYVTEASLNALSNYVRLKKLDWEIKVGFSSINNEHATYRAVPRVSIKHEVHVIMPYKNQKEMTLKAVSSILSQTDVKVKITAINNNSTDTSIERELHELGVEVLTINEPFNYSRLNNLGVKNSKIGKSDDLVLFMNNDVELKTDALLEMTRWVDQPNIGMVGCRLNYPNGRLQHAGVYLDKDIYLGFKPWKEIDKYRVAEKLAKSKQIYVCDAVTAACALIKRENFENVGGFDEVWYPIAYSDTNLCLKLKSKGLVCLYTPFAEGTHYESATRANSYEDYEASEWLHLQWKDANVERETRD